MYICTYMYLLLNIDNRTFTFEGCSPTSLVTLGCRRAASCSVDLSRDASISAIPCSRALALHLNPAMPAPRVSRIPSRGTYGCHNPRSQPSCWLGVGCSTERQSAFIPYASFLRSMEMGDGGLRGATGVAARFWGWASQLCRKRPKHQS